MICMAGKKTTKKTTKARTKKTAKKEEKAPEVKQEAKAEVKEEPKKAEPKVEAKPEVKAEVKEVKAPPKAETKEAPEKPKEKKTRKRKISKKKPTTKAVVVRGKRKRSIARAAVREGTGIIRLNSVNLEAVNNTYVREIIKEPLRYMGPEANTVNISVNVEGGGVMGQAQAARTAIARALAEYFGELKLKEKFIAIDRSLIVEDTRRVEPKKYRGPKARARYQKSYR